MKGYSETQNQRFFVATMEMIAVLFLIVLKSTAACEWIASLRLAMTAPVENTFSKYWDSSIAVIRLDKTTREHKIENHWPGVQWEGSSGFVLLQNWNLVLTPKGHNRLNSFKKELY